MILIVILLQDMVRVALGEIAERTDCVHGNPLLEGEERVCVTQLTNGELRRDGYDIEEGGFCSWNRLDLRKQ